VSLAAAVCCWVGVFGIKAGLPLAYLLFGFAGWLLANHFFEILEHKAEGAAGWPAVSLETIASARTQIGAVFVAALAGLGLAVWALDRAGSESLALLLAVLLAALAPASAALIGVTRSPLRALHPAALVRTVVGFGVGYVVLLLATSAAAAAVVLAFARRTFVVLFAAAYAWQLLGYLIGVFVYQRRAALGVQSRRSPEAREAAEHLRLVQERRAVLDHAYGIAARGHTTGALDYVERYASTEADPLAAKVWFFHEMARWSSGVPALAFGATLRTALEQAGRAAEAAKIALTCRHLEERRPRGTPA
jgi:hypothetical protein